MNQATEAAILVCAFLSAQGPVAAGQARPDSTASKSEAAYPVYRIGPGDVLQIDVWKEPDASVGSVTVRPDGRISLSLIGEVQVAGLTPAQLAAMLSERFGRLIRDPRVTVAVREVMSQKIYLIGEVRTQGPVRMVGPITVLQALAEAGGVTDYAKRNRIYILRMSTAGQVKLPFNYDEVVQGQKVEQNVLLLPGDTIVIPR